MRVVEGKDGARLTKAPRVRAHIRLSGVRLNDDERLFVRKKLGMRFGKFAKSIERVSVRLSDINGPRGGVDLRCRVKVVLRGLPSIVAESRSASLMSAINRALAISERGVRNALRRRRGTRTVR